MCYVVYLQICQILILDIYDYLYVAVRLGILRFRPHFIMPYIEHDINEVV